MTTAGAPALTYSSAPGRWVLAITVLGSGIASLDATVVNIALPTIGRDFHTGVAALQWVMNGYTLTLTAFLLIGGSLGDRFGRRKVYLTGIVWFTLASVACGLAPGAVFLIVTRLLQGIGAALLTPGSLAILEASFVPADRGRAIGAWSGLSGVAIAAGPLIGGYLISAVRERQFAATNAATFIVYGALTGATFLLPVVLQVVSGYSPLASGLALLPMTVIMLALSARSGKLAARIGPRLQMSAGPVVVGTGLAMLTLATHGSSYVLYVLPAVAVFGLGLAITVAPLTATAMNSAPAEQSGIASAVNNDVARFGCPEPWPHRMFARSGPGPQLSDTSAWSWAPRRRRVRFRGMCRTLLGVLERRLRPRSSAKGRRPALTRSWPRSSTVSSSRCGWSTRLG